MTFKNMKIEINKAQPIDEVVGELERLIYTCWAWTEDHNGFVFTWDNGDYTNTEEDLEDIDYEFHVLTTLAELKEM